MSVIKQTLVQPTLYVALPNQLAHEIQNWGQKHISDSKLYKIDNKTGREKNIHLTILYRVNDSNLDKIKKITDDQRSFNVTLGCVNLFYNQEYDVIKINAYSTELCKLHTKLAKTLEHNNIYSNFQPHVTVAYVKKNSCWNLVDDTTFEDRVFTIEHLTLAVKDTTFPFGSTSNISDIAAEQLNLI